MKTLIAVIFLTFSTAFLDWCAAGIFGAEPVDNPAEELE